MTVPTEAQRVTNALLAEFGVFAEAQESSAAKPTTMDAIRGTAKSDTKQKSSANPYSRNPYARMKGTNDQPRSDRKKRARETNADSEESRTSLSLQKLLKKSGSEIYIGNSHTKTISEFASNAPADLTCSICDRHMAQPFISECGHMACYSCWDAWLKKTGTCAHCRKPVALNSLAKAVFKDS